MPDENSMPHGAPRFSGLRRSALATALIGASVLVGNGLFVGSAAAAALCATPPLTGTTTASGVINTYYPAQTAVTAGTSNTTVTVGTSRGSATPIAVGDLVLVVQMQGAQIDSTNTNAYGDGVVSATASGFLNNASFIAGQYEYATVRSVAGAVVGLNGAGANGGLVNSYVNANETATQGQQRFQIVRVPQYSSATLSAATPPAAVAWDGSSGGIVVLDVASNLNLNGAAIDVSGQGFRPGLQRSRSGATGLANTDYRTATASTANGQKAEGIAGTAKWTTGAADTVGDGYPNGDFARGAPGNAGGGGTDGDPVSNGQNSGGGGGGNGGAGGVGGNTWSSNLRPRRLRRRRGAGYSGTRVPRWRRRRGQRQQRGSLVGRWRRRWHRAGSRREPVGHRHDHRRRRSRKCERSGRQRRWRGRRLDRRAHDVDGRSERHRRTDGESARWCGRQRDARRPTRARRRWRWWTGDHVVGHGSDDGHRRRERDPRADE